jgi:hypothetical protein
LPCYKGTEEYVKGVKGSDLDGASGKERPFSRCDIKLKNEDEESSGRLWRMGRSF